MIKPGTVVEQPNKSSIAKATDFGSGMVLAVYVAAVLYQGNMKALGQTALQDYGYLEWLVAIVILYEIYKLTNNKLIALLIGIAVVAVMLKITKTNTTLVSTIGDFAKGKTDIFGVLTSLAPTGKTAPATQATPTSVQPTQTPQYIQPPPQPTQTNTTTQAAYTPSPIGAGGSILSAILGVA